LPLTDELKTLKPEYMAAPFWFWNDVIDPAEVRRQIAEMAAQNIGGFFMHARMGRITGYMSDEWMAAVKAAVDEAKKLGLYAWIYDEDGWPSGFGGGLVNALGEDYLQRYATAQIIHCPNGQVPAIENDQEIVAAYAARKTDGGMQQISQLDTAQLPSAGDSLPDAGQDHLVIFRKEVHNYRRYFSPEAWADGYVDVIDPKVTKGFIEQIYEAYAREIGDDFGSTVLGVFTDEPSYHERDWMSNDIRLPFTGVLKEEFEKRFSSPLEQALPAIAHGGKDAIRARWCYYTSLAYLFATNYTHLLAEWCDKHKLFFTGHFLLEENPRCATHVIGDPMLHYYYQQYPGIDHLGKDLDLKDFWSSARVLVKQASSIAHQFDKDRVMCETYAGGGWHFGVAEQKWMGDWQYALGLNLVCQHAFHYSLRGFRKRDYPPSLSFQQPWWPFSEDLGSHFARLGYLVTRGSRVVNVLVLHPIESFFATHDPAGFPWPEDDLGDGLKKLVHNLLSHQVDFDFGNEVLMAEHARIEDGSLVLGKGTYDIVVMPHSVTWRQSTIDLLNKFVEAGGQLFSVDPKPTHVDGFENSVYDELLSRGKSLGHWADPNFEPHIVGTLAPSAKPACQLTHDDDADHDVLVMHRRTDQHDIFFLTSASKTPHTSRARFNVTGLPMLLDTAEGTLTPLPHTSDGEACLVELNFDYARSFPIIFDRNTRRQVVPETVVSERTLCKVGDELPYQMDRDNAAILDRGELFVDDESLGQMMYLDADVLLREKAQPVSVRMRYSIVSEVPVASASLLLETPDRFDVSVNGQALPCSEAAPWVVDPCMKKNRIPGGLRAGENTVEIRFQWQEEVEIEPMYLLGQFGTSVEDNQCRIVRLPDRLRVGSWHDQGLPFYAGAVTYPLQVDLKKAEKWELEVPEYRSAVRVLVNGVDTGTILWAPHRLDITRWARVGTNRIQLEVAGNLRNFMGPHHLSNEDEIDCLGPANFFDKKHRVKEYRLKPMGLLGPVILRSYRMEE
jgi:hypothetical protein